MAYTPDELKLLTSAGGGTGQIWVYEGNDAAATVIAANFISDAASKGMNVGDLVIIREFTSAAKTTLTAQSLHSVTTVASTGATLGAALAGGGTVAVGSGTATPDKDLDSGDGYSLGSQYVETDVDESYTCVDNTVGAAIWNSSDDHSTLSFLEVTASGAAAKVIRVNAPFTGRIQAIRTILNGTITTGNLTVTAAVTGTAVSGGVVTVTQSVSPAAGKKNAVEPSLTATSNKFTKGQTITLTTGGTAAGTKTVNIYLVLRKQTVA